MEPQVNQYGSHMVMTNVVKPSKKKYINIDTKYRDEYTFYETDSLVNYNISLPERITEVRNMYVCNAEIPMTIYNISSELGNNFFQITNVLTANTELVTIPSGDYTITSLVSAINTAISLLASPYKKIQASISATSSNNIVFTNTDNTNTLTLSFDLTLDGSLDKYNFKRKLGWVLGFRYISYTLDPRHSITSENVADLTGVRYVYLVVDEFSKGNQNSFLGPLPTSLIRKNILAKIVLDRQRYPFGSILPANNTNGYLLTDRRSYTGKIDLQKLNVQLVDDIGKPVNLNGMDFSFCIEVEHE